MGTLGFAPLITASCCGLEATRVPSCRCMLAEKLLSKGNYDCDREIRTLELLKLRFGEANLLNCEARPVALAPAVFLTQSGMAPYMSACILLHATAAAEAFQVQRSCWQLGEGSTA